MTILSNWSNISPRLFDAIVFVEKEDTYRRRGKKTPTYILSTGIMIFLDLALVELGWRDE